MNLDVRGMRKINAMFSHASHVPLLVFQEKRPELFRQMSFIALALGLILSGCSSEPIQSGETKKSGEPASAVHGHRPPIIRSARIVPNPVVLNQLISVQVEALDLDGDLITYRHQWRVNEQILAGQIHAMFSSSTMLKRGDRLSVEVTPYDGTIEGPHFLAESIVGNTPPDVMKVVFEPTEVRVGERLKTQVAGSDADEDPIEYRYRWWRNNSEVADGDVSELDTNGFAKGDTVVVEVTPADPTSKGKSKISNPITILNSAPKITTVPPTKIERGRFIYAVSAKDPDGDQLTYALEVAPPGMKIDKLTGRIEWPLNGKLVGNHKVRVTAMDGEQAKAFQEFDLTFSAPVNSSRMTIPKHFGLNTRLVTPFAPLLE
jgi:translation initiation factor IF-1